MELTVETFAPHLGSTFVVGTQAGELTLVLREVTPLPRGARPAWLRDPVSLVFEGPDHIALLQDNYPIAHPVLGQAEFCLVPIDGPVPGGPQDVKRLYQTIFN